MFHRVPSGTYHAGHIALRGGFCLVRLEAGRPVCHGGRQGIPERESAPFDKSRTTDPHDVGWPGLYLVGISIPQLSRSGRGSPPSSFGPWQAVAAFVLLQPGLIPDLS